MDRRTVRTITSSTWFLVLALLVSFGMPAGAAPQAPANINVSALAGNDAEDAIAINPTNPSNIVAMSVLPVGVVGLFEGVSFDGGLTWTRQIIGAGDNLGDICCDQQLAWDSFGNLWMVYLHNVNRLRYLLLLIVPLAYEIVDEDASVPLTTVILIAGACSALVGIGQYSILHYDSLNLRLRGTLGMWMTLATRQARPGRRRPMWPAASAA